MKWGLLLIPLLISLLPEEVWGKFAISPGVSFTTPTESKEMTAEGSELVKLKHALGIELDGEFHFWGPLSINLGGVWRSGEGHSEYRYTEEGNPLESAQVSHLETRSTVLGGFFGSRVRFINLQSFKSYFGGGYTRGHHYLTFDENKFKLAVGSRVGFKDNEHKEFEGYFYEGGIEILSGEGGSLRFMARRAEYKTRPFESLGNRSISFIFTTFGILYVHPMK